MQLRDQPGNSIYIWYCIQLFFCLECHRELITLTEARLEVPQTSFLLPSMVLTRKGKSHVVKGELSCEQTIVSPTRAIRARPSLLGLPAEIRTEIYKYVFTGEILIVEDYGTMPPRSCDFRRTCLTIYAEAMPFFYSTVTLRHNRGPKSPAEVVLVTPYQKLIPCLELGNKLPARYSPYNYNLWRGCWLQKGLPTVSILHGFSSLKLLKIPLESAKIAPDSAMADTPWTRADPEWIRIPALPLQEGKHRDALLAQLWYYDGGPIQPLVL